MHITPTPTPSMLVPRTGPDQLGSNMRRTETDDVTQYAIPKEDLEGKSYTEVSQTLGAASTASTAETSRAKGSFPMARTAEDIFADYDLNNISPREIDQLADDLRENGVYDFEQMMMLETRGEKFTMHLQESLKAAGVIDEISFDPTQKFDYLAATADEVEQARRSGEPYELAQESLNALLAVQERSDEIRAERDAATPPRNTPTPHPAISQSVFGMQASAA